MQEDNLENGSLIEFDALLSNLLNEKVDSKELEDKAQIYLAAFYSGISRNLLDTKEIGEYNTSNCKETLNEIDSKQIGVVALNNLSENEQLLNVMKKLNQNNDSNFEVANEKITLVKEKELNTSIESLLGSNTNIREVVAVEMNKNSAFKVSSEEIQGDNEIAPIQDTSIEQSNVEKMKQDLQNDIGKVISKGIVSDSSINKFEEESDFPSIKSATKDTQDKKMGKPKQILDFSIVQGKEPTKIDNSIAIVGKNDQLTEVIGDQIIKSASFIQKNGKQEFEIQLKPDFLGKIMIKLQSGEDGFHVKISTSNMEVKDILTAQLPLMQESLKSHGVDLQNAEIVYTGLTNSNQDSANDSRYLGNHKKSSTQAKGEYERAMISSSTEPIQEISRVYNGAVDYLV